LRIEATCLQNAVRSFVSVLATNYTKFRFTTVFETQGAADFNNKNSN